ncbi:hypothetical protein [Nakamurella antarctica]|uniref:hypothetical protein n=1 Tax=Nakamurella antarctica TaxID=1902245 RepID=UPI0019D03526|nr:hypothetical protein [Nakamurella antarctica]
MALIAGQQLYMAVIVYSDGADVSGDGASSGEPNGSPVGPAGGLGSKATILNVTNIRSELQVASIAWQDPLNLLVAGFDSSTSPYRIVFSIGLDGRRRTALSTKGLIGDVTAIGAGTPTLVAFEGRIWALVGEDSSASWETAGSFGQVLTGTYPFYPR